MLNYADSNNSSHTLTDLIQAEINRHGGAISFAKFMQLALYDSCFGYYNAEHFSFGKAGDFTTAPEISPLFAKCFAQPIKDILTQLHAASFLELGAGSGSFARDLITELTRLDCLPEKYFIYEISLTLRRQQQALLSAAHPDYFNRVVWLDALPENFVGVIFANEVLDAMPVHRFHLAANEIKECGVAWQDGFKWELIAPTSVELASRAQKISLEYGLQAPYESEINLNMTDFIQKIANACKQAFIFFADYGYGEREYYSPLRQHGTLNCFYKHNRHDNPLLMPGKQDITAHVNFTDVAECGLAAGLELAGYTTQAAFLLDCGLTNMVAEAQVGLSNVESYRMQQAIKYLTLPSEMGERIKVIGLCKNLNEVSELGFRLNDQRVRL